jgi:hypothetical protein
VTDFAPKRLDDQLVLARLDRRDRVRSARYQADTFQFHRYEDKMTQLFQSSENHTLDRHR